MASHQDLVAGAGVAAVLVAGFFLNRLMAHVRPRAVAASGTGGMMGRFATHRGSVVGEVVGITTDRLVLRQGGIHKAVPLRQARLQDGDVALEGDIDWAAAEEAGRSWAPPAGPPPQGGT